MPRPLHDTPIEPRAWWACFQPERPVDGWCVYDLQCPKCTIKANVGNYPFTVETLATLGPLDRPSAVSGAESGGDEPSIARRGAA